MVLLLSRNLRSLAIFRHSILADYKYMFSSIFIYSHVILIHSQSALSEYSKYWSIVSDVELVAELVVYRASLEARSVPKSSASESRMPAPGRKAPRTCWFHLNCIAFLIYQYPTNSLMSVSSNNVDLVHWCRSTLVLPQ